MAKTKVWKNSYGDGEETIDSVLWVDRKPTDVVISPISSACMVLYIGNREVGMFDSKKEAKEYFEENFKFLFDTKTYELQHLHNGKWWGVGKRTKDVLNNPLFTNIKEENGTITFTFNSWHTNKKQFRLVEVK